jgi:photosystem II stability/assembly factor-like uncharacterized protein
MNLPSYPKYLVALLLACLAGERAQGQSFSALRSLGFDGQRVWAVGDRATVLVSQDAGKTFTPVEVPEGADFHDVLAFQGEAWILGGASIPGHPQGWARGEILRIDAEGDVQRISTGKLGHLHGGWVRREGLAVIGQANAIFPHGAAFSPDRGRTWKGLARPRTGTLLSAAGTCEAGLAVGSGQSVLDYRAGRLEPAEMDPQGPALRCCQIAQDGVAWAAGDQATILRRTDPNGTWSPVGLTLPGRTRRLADLNALAVASGREAWLAGGAIGSILHTRTASEPFALLPAPKPGPVTDLLRLPDGVLLACGHAGRIWRSTDGAKSWQRVHGQEDCDVLVIASAGDRSVFPAIVAHAQAGCTVEVVFATTPGMDSPSPGPASLEQAARLAGAAGCLVLGEFSSVESVPQGANMSQEQILQLWTRRIDTDARAEMILQLAAAIRLHRPRVLLTGPEGTDRAGSAMEARLVSQLAREAIFLAADPDENWGLGRIGLVPWEPRRVFRGLKTNDAPDWPWLESPATDDNAHVVIDLKKIPVGGSDTLEMMTLASLAALGDGILDRPPLQTGYKMRKGRQRIALCTTGLTAHRLAARYPGDDRAALASYSRLRYAQMRNAPEGVLQDYVRAARKAPEGDLLAADRLLVLWARLCSLGRWEAAREAQNVLLETLEGHPQFLRFNCLALAMEFSAEARVWRQANQVRPGKEINPARVIDAFGNWWPWSNWPPGRVLYASGLGKTGRPHQQIDVLSQMSQSPGEDPWSTYAAFEVTGKNPLRGNLMRRQIVRASTNRAPGKLDGLLNEPAWQQAKIYRLQGSAQASARGFVQVVRSASHLLVGLKIDDVPGGWKIELAMDADRDAWTQLVAEVTSRGRRASRLWLRLGPDTQIQPDWFQVQGQKSGGKITLELAIPLKALGGDLPDRQIWNFQVRASRIDRPGSLLMLQLSDEGGLAPESAAVLVLPPKPIGQTPDQGDPPSGR